MRAFISLVFVFFLLGNSRGRNLRGETAEQNSEADKKDSSATNVGSAGNDATKVSKGWQPPKCFVTCNHDKKKKKLKDCIAQECTSEDRELISNYKKKEHQKHTPKPKTTAGNSKVGKQDGKDVKKEVSDGTNNAGAPNKVGNHEGTPDTANGNQKNGAGTGTGGGKDAASKVDDTIHHKATDDGDSAGTGTDNAGAPNKVGKLEGTPDAGASNESDNQNHGAGTGTGGGKGASKDGNANGKRSHHSVQNKKKSKHKFVKLTATFSALLSDTQKEKVRRIFCDAVEAKFGRIEEPLCIIVRSAQNDDDNDDDNDSDFAYDLSASAESKSMKELHEDLGQQLQDTKDKFVVEINEMDSELLVGDPEVADARPQNRNEKRKIKTSESIKKHESTSPLTLAVAVVISILLMALLLLFIYRFVCKSKAASKPKKKRKKTKKIHQKKFTKLDNFSTSSNDDE